MNQFGCFFGRDRERLFEIDMSAGLQTLPGESKVALRRRGDMNDVGIRFPEHLSRIGKTSRNAKTLAELPRHEQFPVADGHDLAVRNSMDRLNMLVRDLTAADERYAKHCLEG